MIARSAIIPLTKSSVLHDLVAWERVSVKYLSVKDQGKSAREMLQGIDILFP